MMAGACCCAAKQAKWGDGRKDEPDPRCGVMFLFSKGVDERVLGMAEVLKAFSHTGTRDPGPSLACK